MEAAIQVFYSLGTGFGCILTMSSYNKFNNNCVRDSVLLTFCCEGTSLYGGFVVFMILGHMAFKSGVHISKFAESGAGLAFVVYPEAISYLPLPQFWGVVIFLMFYTLGLDSLFVLAETPLTVLTDFYPRFVHRWRAMVTVLFMVALTLLSLLFSTRAGIYWFTLVDWYFAAFLLFFHVILECVAISWFYGFDRFSKDVVLMTGRKPYLVLEWGMKYVTPLFVTIVCVVTLFFYQPPVYKGYEFPASAVTLGWLCAVLPGLAIVGCAIHEVYKQRSGSLRKRMWFACQPNSDWMPASKEVRETYNHLHPVVDDVGLPDAAV